MRTRTIGRWSRYDKHTLAQALNPPRPCLSLFPLSSSLLPFFVPVFLSFDLFLVSKPTHHCFLPSLPHSLPLSLQVYISYGPKSNADLLLLYGFCLDRNPYNSVEITVSLLEQDPLFDDKRVFLSQVDRREREAFPLFADR